MLYSILKTIIDTTLSQYICQSCSGRIDENSLSIQEITDHALHMEVHCPHCQSHARINAEIANMGYHPDGATPDANMIIQKVIQKNEHAIKEEDIKTVEQNLQNSQSIEDLLK